MDDIRRATVIELAGANLVIRAGVLHGVRGFTMIRKGRRLSSEPPPGPNCDHRCARCDDTAELLAIDGDYAWVPVPGAWLRRDVDDAGRVPRPARALPGHGNEARRPHRVRDVGHEAVRD